MLMDDKTLGILILGILVVGFAAFASFMADRQNDRDKHSQ